MREEIRKLIESKDRKKIEEYLRNNAKHCDMFEPSSLLMSFGDIEYAKSIIENPDIPLTYFQKEAVIVLMKDYDYMMDCVQGEIEGVELDGLSRARLYMEWNYVQNYIIPGVVPYENLEDEYEQIIWCNRRWPSLKKQSEVACAALDDEIFELDADSRACLIQNVEPYEKMIEYFLANITELDANYKMAFLEGSGNNKRIANLIDEILNKESDYRVIEKMAELMEKGTDEMKQRVLTIGSVSELSVETLQENPNIAFVKIKDEENPAYYWDVYTRDKYIAIRTAIDELLEGVPAIKKGNINSELKTFSMVFSKLAKIEYDDFAVSEDGKKDGNLQIVCRNLEGAFIEGKCVCVGFAKALKEVLKCVNIDCIKIGGHDEKGNSGHAWNQVKIGNHWLNCDLTNYGCWSFLGKKCWERVLKSDEEFKDYAEYSRDRAKEEKKCEVSIEQLKDKEKNSFKNYIKKWASKLSWKELKATNDMLNGLKEKSEEKTTISEERDN